MREGFLHGGRVSMEAFYGLNIRKEPSKDAELAFILPRTLEVEIKDFKDSDEWVYIYSKDFDNEGWCLKQYLDIVPNPNPVG